MKYTDYIAQEIKQILVTCAEKAQLKHHYFQTPAEPVIKNVGKVNYGESNYAVGPLTKTIYVSDTIGNRYKISVEDLKNVKGFGWITHKEADKYNLVYNREEGRYNVS
jgi:hypothetical protein|tara:strand:- start:1397 stop:1720 length:324 start_codon:yes stop_codon:yes gene_type:complete